ncbi:MAG: GGDEF domain-containing protein [Thiotrichales bacterium]|nr:GGDEF domain-containing protein [Thiotrichales bacterium]
MKINPALFSQANFETLIEASQDGGILLDSNEIIVFCNSAVEKLLGCSAEHMLFQRLPPVIDAHLFHSLKQLCITELKTAQLSKAINKPFPANRLDTYAHKHDGEHIWVEVSLSILPADNRHFFYLQLKQKAKSLVADSALKNLSAIDELTGLSNRREFQRLLESHINHPLSVAIMDIDQYKQINHQFGFQVGDSALQAFSDLLKITFPDAICVARLRADEFGVVYSGGVGSGFYKKCETFREQVTQLDLVEYDVPLTVSIGVAKYVENSRKLMSKADEALVVAKRNGRNRVHMLLK